VPVKFAGEKARADTDLTQRRLLTADMSHRRTGPGPNNNGGVLRIGWGSQVDLGVTRQRGRQHVIESQV
jgi:hypothetical protein